MTHRNADEEFEWDMTAVLILTIGMMLLLLAVFSLWPLGHVR